MSGALLLLGAALAGGVLGPPLLRRVPRLAADPCRHVERALCQWLAPALGAAVTVWLLDAGPLASTAAAAALVLLLGMVTVVAFTARGLDDRRRKLLAGHGAAAVLLLLLALRATALEASALGYYPAGRPLLLYLVAGAHARPVLFREARSADPEVRREAEWALWQMDGHNRVEEWVEALRAPDARTRVEAVEALRALGSEAGTEELVGLLGDPEPRLRDLAREILGRRQSAVPFLLWTLRDGRSLPGSADASNGSRIAAGVARRMEPVRRRLGPRWRRARLAAVSLAAEGGRGHAAASLTLACQDPDPVLRAAALRALGTRAITRELARLACGPVPETAAAAWTALRALPPHSLAALRQCGHGHRLRPDCAPCRVADRLAREMMGPPVPARPTRGWEAADGRW